MTDEDIRRLIAEALRYAAVPHFRDSDVEAAFVAGARDIAVRDLDIDSLASMELCIAIETSTGVSIVPGDLVSIASLGQLVDRVRGG
ncbi:MAG: acyl carrier protein [Hyphomicrobiales bacterium]|nr:MAG: acyl carrier protein [Hyphomicrobiales bacterium]